MQPVGLGVVAVISIIVFFRPALVVLDIAGDAAGTAVRTVVGIAVIRVGGVPPHVPFQRGGGVPGPGEAGARPGVGVDRGDESLEV